LFLETFQFLLGILKDQDTGSGVFTAEEGDGIGDNSPGDITTVNVDISRFENFPLLPKHQDFWNSGVQIKEFYCITITILVRSHIY